MIYISFINGISLHISSEMDGPRAPEDWHGGLNVSYNLGPGLTKGNNLRMEIRTHIENVTVYNVIGKIEGREEPGIVFTHTTLVNESKSRYSTKT